MLPHRCVELCRSADLLLHGGDVVSLAFWDELGRLGPPLAGVRGNMDEPMLRELLPTERIVEVGGARIGVLHDAGPRAGREERLARLFPDSDAVVYGHTHIPQVTKSGDVWILNPGSPTERRRAPTRSMLVVDVNAGSLNPTLIEL